MLDASVVGEFTALLIRSDGDVTRMTLFVNESGLTSSCSFSTSGVFSILFAFNNSLNRTKSSPFS